MSRPHAIALITLCFVAAIGASTAQAADDVRATLLRQTQELCDAVSAGDSTVWDRYLDPRVVYVDEAGGINRKPDLTHYIKPFPKEITGKLVVKDFTLERYGQVALTTHIVDEAENYFGQQLHCRYLTSDTWQLQSAGWRLIASFSQALREDPPAITLPVNRLADYAGRYELTPDVQYAIRVVGDSLVGQRDGRKPETLRAEVPDLFFVPGSPRLRKVFGRGADGSVTAFVERREAWDLVWQRVP